MAPSQEHKGPFYRLKYETKQFLFFDGYSKMIGLKPFFEFSLISFVLKLSLCPSLYQLSSFMDLMYPSEILSVESLKNQG